MSILNQILRAHESYYLTVADALGNDYTFTYNSHHDILTKTDARGSTTQYEYSANGKPTKVTDAVYNSVYYQYDGEDLLTAVTDARGNTTTFSYDAKGRLTGVTDPLGNIRTIQYDPCDRVIGQTDALGNKILTVTYDALGNPVTVMDGVYRTTTTHYDQLNRPDKITDPASRVTQYYYDEMNRLKSVIDPRLGRSTQVFDVDGNLSVLVDPNNNQTTFTYDKAGRLTGVTPPAGGQTTYLYNSRNLLSQKTNGRGQVTDFQYNDAGRLTGSTDPAGTVSFGYDPNGNLLSAGDSNGTAAREYDKLNRVTKYTDANGNIIQYEYDANGNLITLTYPGDKQVHYEYDKCNRLTKVTDWAGRETAYKYDANGRLIRTMRPDGSVQTQQYDQAGQLLQQKDLDRNGSVISQYDFTYDKVGNVANENSAITEQPFTVNDGVMTYAYGNRLATFNGQNVVYDNDGNMTTGPLNGAMGNYTFDARNRLVSAGDLTYQYDAENNRTKVTDTVYGTAYSYVVNPNAYLSQTLIQIDNLGNKTYYIYGLGLIGQENPDGSYQTYHFDRRGSTVAISNESGTVTDRFQYAPYGELVYRTGSTKTPFLFNGRYGVMTDSNGLYHMRARYYNPQIKRFVNQDVLLGSIKKGQGMNRYAYANGNPVSFIDPFGLRCEDDGDGSFWDYLSDSLNVFNDKYIGGFLNLINDSYGPVAATGIAVTGAAAVGAATVTALETAVGDLGYVVVTKYGTKAINVIATVGKGLAFQTLTDVTDDKPTTVRDYVFSGGMSAISGYMYNTVPANFDFNTEAGKYTSSQDSPWVQYMPTP